MYLLVLTMNIILSVVIVGYFFNESMKLYKEKDFVDKPTIDFYKNNKKYLHPNFICYFRLNSGPVIALTILIAYLFENYYLLACIMPFMSFSGIGDMLDGAIAKNCGLSSVKGAILDPLADKAYYLPIILVYAIISSMFIVSMFMNNTFIYLTVIIIIFDIIGTLLRSKMNSKSAEIIGKCKTIFIMTYMFFFQLILCFEAYIVLYIEEYLFLIEKVSVSFLTIAMLLTIASAVIKMLNLSKTKAA